MIDKAIVEFDKALRTVFAPARTARAVPGRDLPEGEFDEAGRRDAANLMRVNHCGEVCAQALYQGQALSSRDPGIKKALEGAAAEETEHLAWTEQRIGELGGRKSLLNPLWYTGSFALGVIAGRMGDGWNLGFLAETERQVEAHLGDHLQQLPDSDERSRQIVSQMQSDEADHAEMAQAAGARPLPRPIPQLMRRAADVMKAIAYRL